MENVYIDKDGVMHGKSIYHIDCIHKKHLVNQGIVMCDIGDPSKCDECKHKTPKDVESEWSSISI